MSLTGGSCALKKRKGTSHWQKTTFNVQKPFGNTTSACAHPGRLRGQHLDFHPGHNGSRKCGTNRKNRAVATVSATTEPRGLTTPASRLAHIFTIATVPGRGAAVVACVMLLRLLHRDEEDPVRSHPTATRTIQFAADMPSGRNGQLATAGAARGAMDTRDPRCSSEADVSATSKASLSSTD